MRDEVPEIYAGFAEPFMALPYLAALILVALPLAALLGFRLGQIERRRRSYDRLPPDQVPGATSVGAMLALLGLLLGFAFSSALNWREARQSALVEEAAAIGTAFLTADLLEDPGRTELQARILGYARTRVASQDDIASSASWNAFLANTLAAQAAIWPTTLQAIDGATSDPIRATVARAVTEMLDAHTRRIAAAAEQIPGPAKLMLFLAAFVAILVAANRSALQGRSLTWRTFVFAGLLAVVIIVILDLDRTLEGTMRVNPDTLNATIREMEAVLAVR